MCYRLGSKIMVPVMLALQGANEVRVRDSLHALYKLGVILLSMCKRY